MVYVLLTDGELVEVPDADTANEEGEEIVCRDLEGVLLTLFPSKMVNAYGCHEAMAQYRNKPTR